MVYYILDTCIFIIICTCGVAWLVYAYIVYGKCVHDISVYIVVMIICQERERKRVHPHPQTVFCYVFRCHVSAIYSCMSYNYEARQCISVKLFYQCNCWMQTNILFTARIITRMIYYIEVIVDPWYFIIIIHVPLFYSMHACTLTQR